MKNKKGVEKMGNLFQKAIAKQKQFYIYELIKTGMFTDMSSLTQWTVKELRHEYERNVLQRKKKKLGG